MPEKARHGEETRPAKTFLAETEVDRLKTGRDRSDDVDAERLNVGHGQVDERDRAPRRFEPPLAESEVILHVAAAVVGHRRKLSRGTPIEEEVELAKVFGVRREHRMILERRTSS